MILLSNTIICLFIQVVQNCLSGHLFHILAPLCEAEQARVIYPCLSLISRYAKVPTRIATYHIELVNQLTTVIYINKNPKLDVYSP